MQDRFETGLSSCEIRGGEQNTPRTVSCHAAPPPLQRCETRVGALLAFVGARGAERQALAVLKLLLAGNEPGSRQTEAATADPAQGDRSGVGPPGTTDHGPAEGPAARHAAPPPSALPCDPGIGIEEPTHDSFLLYLPIFPALLASCKSEGFALHLQTARESCWGARMG